MVNYLVWKSEKVVKHMLRQTWEHVFINLTILLKNLSLFWFVKEILGRTQRLARFKLYGVVYRPNQLNGLKVIFTRLQQVWAYLARPWLYTE